MENKNGPLTNKDIHNTLTRACIQDEDEIDLVELIAILWQHRTLIVSIFCVCTLAGIIYCLAATPMYEINAQIRPGITGYDEQDHPIRSLTPEAIKFWFEKKGYNKYFKDHINEDTVSIRATIEKESEFVNLSMSYPDKQKGVQTLVKILENYSQSLKRTLFNEIQVTINKLNEKINRFKSELESLTQKESITKTKISKLQDNIKLLKTKLQALNKNKDRLENMKKRLEQQIENIQKNTNDLILLRKEMINPQKKINVDRFALLMYSNIIQQNISYITTLEEKVAAIDKELNNFFINEKQIKNSIQTCQLNIKDTEIMLEKQIPLLKEGVNKNIAIVKAQVTNISPIEIIQVPFSSVKPVKPHKALIIAVSMVIGLFLAILFAFIKNCWQTSKHRHIATAMSE